jgi:hypothetical protein
MQRLDLLRADPDAAFNDNFIEATMKYAYHMRRYIAMQEALDAAKGQGIVQYAVKPPADMVALEGRTASLKGIAQQMGGRYYAPPDFAKDWNNFASEGFSGQPKTALDAVREVSNFTNRIKLFGLYHPFTVTLSSISSPLAVAIDNLSYGKPWEAIKALRAVPVAPIKHFALGAQGTAEYLHPGVNPELSQIVNALSEANFNPSAVDRSLSITSQGSLYDAWRKGILGSQLRALDEGVTSQPTAGTAAVASFKAAANLIGRTFETLTAPLFNYLIPRIKTGAAIESMQAYLKAHPFVTHDEVLAQARQIQKTMDDRFGEMNWDTVFWDRKAKEALQAGLLSATWQYGFLRSTLLGARDIASVAAKTATGGRLAPNAEWSRRASYAVAWPAIAALANAAYQHGKTGKPPGGLEDLALPQTGVNRALLPGHMKDLLELLRFFTGEANAIDIESGKANPFLKAAVHVLINKDWKGTPLADPGANILLHWAERLGAGGAEAVTPIFLSDGRFNPDIGGLEKALGVNKAGQANQAFIEHPFAGLTGEPTGTFVDNKARRDYYEGKKYDLENHEKAGTATKAERDNVARLKSMLPKK